MVCISNISHCRYTEKLYHSTTAVIARVFFTADTVTSQSRWITGGINNISINFIPFRWASSSVLQSWSLDWPAPSCCYLLHLRFPWNMCICLVTTDRFQIKSATTQTNSSEKHRDQQQQIHNEAEFPRHLSWYPENTRPRAKTASGKHQYYNSAYEDVRISNQCLPRHCLRRKNRLEAPIKPRCRGGSAAQVYSKS